MTREQLDDVTMLMGRGISASLTDTFGLGRVGFTLLLFERGGTNDLTYASNVEPEEMIKALRDLLVRLVAAPRVS